MMPAGSVSIEIEADPGEIFDLVHDYSRRLDWDPFLREAILLNGAVSANVGVISRCASRYSLGGFAMDTKYISFSKPTVAAVSMTRGPFFLRKFAASIRQKQMDDNLVRVTYRYLFEVKPWIVPLVMEPIIGSFFQRETRKRLIALKEFLELKN